MLMDVLQTGGHLTLRTALETLKKAGLLSGHSKAMYFQLIAKHQNPEVAAMSLSILSKHKQLTERNISLVQEMKTS